MIVLQLFFEFALLSFVAFGGATALLPEMHRVVVENNHWLNDATFTHLYAIAQAAPGPNVLVVTLIGWEVAGLAGALAATAAMCLPMSILIYLLIDHWERFAGQRWQKSISIGVSPLAVGLIFSGATLIAQAQDAAGSDDFGDFGYGTSWQDGLGLLTDGLAHQARLSPLGVEIACGDIQRGRAEQAERERDANARAAGAHIKTIAELRAQLAEALRAVHRPASAEQIPGVAAARTLSRLECSICPYVARELDEEAGDKCPACGSKLAEVESCDACGKPVRDGERTGEAEAVLLCGRCTCKAEAEEAARATAVTEIEPPPRIASRSVRYEAVMRRSDEINAGTDDSPPTRPSERAATRTT